MGTLRRKGEGIWEEPSTMGGICGEPVWYGAGIFLGELVYGADDWG